MTGTSATAIGFCVMGIQLATGESIIAFVVSPMQDEMKQHKAFQNHAYAFYAAKKVTIDGELKLIQYDTKSIRGCTRLEIDSIESLSQIEDDEISLYTEFMNTHKITVNEVRTNVGAFFSSVLSDTKPKKEPELIKQHFIFNEEHYPKKQLKKMNFILSNFNSQVLH
jgi:hypothetical protein